MIGDTRRPLLRARPGNLDKLKSRDTDQRWRRPNNGRARSGKAKDTMSAWGMGRRPGRKGRCRAAVVQAQFECRRSIIGRGGRGKRKAAKRDEQTLDGNGISDDDPDQGPPVALSTQFAHTQAYG
jgi:hypothetical protein